MFVVVSGVLHTKANIYCVLTDFAVRPTALSKLGVRLEYKWITYETWRNIKTHGNE